MARKPGEACKGCGGVARAACAALLSWGPGRLTFVVQIGVGGVAQFWTGVGDLGSGTDLVRGRSICTFVENASVFAISKKSFFFSSLGFMFAPF